MPVTPGSVPYQRNHTHVRQVRKRSVDATYLLRARNPLRCTYVEMERVPTCANGRKKLVRRPPRERDRSHPILCLPMDDTRRQTHPRQSAISRRSTRRISRRGDARCRDNQRGRTRRNPSGTRPRPTLRRGDPAAGGEADAPQCRRTQRGCYKEPRFRFAGMEGIGKSQL